MISNVKHSLRQRFPALVNALRLNVYHRSLFYGVDVDAFETAAGIWRRVTQDYGLSRSCHEWKCIDANGEPIPWYTFPVLEYLEQLNFLECDVWEYGAGHSTLWWAKRARSVRAVEDNPAWYEQLRPRLPGNCAVEVILDSELDRYIKSIRRHGRFDVVVVDGPIKELARKRCCEEGAAQLKPGGVIILDNSERLPRACEAMQAAGFTQIDFADFTTLTEYSCCTSVFFKQELRIPRLGKPLRVRGGAIPPQFADWE